MNKKQQEMGIDRALHTYIVYTLSQKRLSQASLARRCGTTPQFINLVITGRRTSEEVQRRIAGMLGFSSWESLTLTANDWQRRLDAMEVRA